MAQDGRAEAIRLELTVSPLPALAAGFFLSSQAAAPAAQSRQLAA
jgi:hypothetical protein